jgi:hypothetical protein
MHYDAATADIPLSAREPVRRASAA